MQAILSVSYISFISYLNISRRRVLKKSNIKLIIFVKIVDL